MKNFIFGLIVSTVLSSASSLYADAEPYASINQLPYEPYYIENAWILSNKVANQGTTNFIDVGSVAGEAARFIAWSTDGSVKIYNINTWKEEQSFQRFLSNVAQENSSEKIIPLRMTSDEAELALNVNSEFIFIECSVEKDVAKKIIGWVTHLTENGIIGGNRWGQPSVELAVITTAVELNLTLQVDQNFWFLKR
jgi:hypothetical protein